MLEAYDVRRHDTVMVAELIYDADPEFNRMVFGSRDEAIDLIRKLTAIPGTFYAAPHLQCLTTEAGLVGIVAGYPIRRQARVEGRVGAAYVRAFGFWNFLKRLPTLLKMNRILSGRMAKEGYYIVYLSVRGTERGKGYGTAMIAALERRWPRLYLHVAVDNDAAIRFYEKNRFRALGVKTGRIGDARVGAILMERQAMSRSERPADDIE